MLDKLSWSAVVCRPVVLLYSLHRGGGRWDKSMRVRTRQGEGATEGRKLLYSPLQCSILLPRKSLERRRHYPH
jgi:hypothetical protein